MKLHRPFLLLELLIALSILLCCIVPLVRNPLSFFQSELSSLENIELERLAILALIEAKEKLYLGENPTKRESFTLELADLPKRKIEKQVTVKIDKDEEQTQAFAKIEVLFLCPKKKEKKFAYKVLLKEKNEISNPLPMPHAKET
jgi:biopolymer transport protein ExbD